MAGGQSILKWTPKFMLLCALRGSGLVNRWWDGFARGVRPLILAEGKGLWNSVPASSLRASGQGWGHLLMGSPSPHPLFPRALLFPSEV